MNEEGAIYKLDIVNSEGPLLKLIKSKKSFILVDQWNVHLTTLNRDEVILFIGGLITIADSKGRRWNFPKVSQNMRVSMDEITDFIGDEYLIDSDKLYELYMEWVDKVSEECDWKTYFEPKEIVYSISKILQENPSLITKNK
jgi:hypothetical protein